MPLRHTIHRDKALENISVAYKPEGLIAQMMPKVPVVRESDVYYVYDRDTMRIEETARTKGKANRASWSMSTTSYTLQNHALQDYVYDKDRDNADKAIRLDIDTTEVLTQKIALRYEQEMATLIQTAGNWANAVSLSSNANFFTNTTNPITVYDSAASVVAQQSGMLPNTIIMDFPTFQTVKENSATVDRVKYTTADSISEGILAKLFNVGRVLVARGVRHTGEEGLADTTTSQGYIWTNTSWIGYLEGSAGLKKASAVYTFQKTIDGNPWRVDRWREEEEEADVIRVQTTFQHRAVATMAGYQIRDTI